SMPRESWKCRRSGTLQFPRLARWSRAEETLVRLVLFIELKAIAQRDEKCVEARPFDLGHLERRQHAPEVGAVIAIVKQADVPASAERIEKLHQRSGPFGELEAAHALRGDVRRTPADHVAHVQLRH